VIYLWISILCLVLFCLGLPVTVQHYLPALGFLILWNLQFMWINIILADCLQALSILRFDLWGMKTPLQSWASLNLSSSVIESSHLKDLVLVFMAGPGNCGYKIGLGFLSKLTLLYYYVLLGWLYLFIWHVLIWI